MPENVAIEEPERSEFLGTAIVTVAASFAVTVAGAAIVVK